MTLKEELDLQLECVRIIIKKVQRTNMNGEFQAACKMIYNDLNSLNGSFKTDKKLKDLEIPNHTHDE